MYYQSMRLYLSHASVRMSLQYLGKDPSQLSSQICQVAILCRSFQIASTCTSLFAKFEGHAIHHRVAVDLGHVKLQFPTTQNAVARHTVHRINSAQRPARPNFESGHVKIPSLGKWRRNCKGVSRRKVCFIYEA